MPNSAHITVRKLAKRFRGSWLFQDFNFTFSPGERIAILGQNGSGKSTFIKILSGYMGTSKGEVEWKREHILDTVYWHQFYSYCAPYQEVVEEFTLQESLDFHFKLKEIRPDVDLSSWLVETNLEKHLNKPVSRFSSGMKQRLKLILCMASKCDVYFLDEPCSNLDIMGADWYQEKIKTLPENSIVFIASNSPKEYEICTRFIEMN